MKRSVSILSLVLMAQLTLTRAARAQWVQADGSGFYGGPPQAVESIGNKLFVGTDQGLFRSLDSGLSWEHVGFLPCICGYDNITGLALIKNTLYAGSLQLNGFLSTDSGASWVPNPGFQPDSRRLCKIGTLFFAGGKDSNGIFVLPDNGTDFIKIDSAYRYQKRGYSVSSSPIDTMCVSSLISIGTRLIAETVPRDPLSVLDDSLNLLISTDSGISWTHPNDSLRYCSGLWTMGGVVFVGSWGPSGSDGGLYRSTDTGATWHQVGAGVTQGFSDCIEYKGFLIGIGDGTYISNDSGITWNPIPINYWLTSIDGELFTFAGTLFAGSVGTFPQASIYRSTDTGKTWIPSSPNYSTSYLGSGGGYLSTVGNTIFAAGLALYRSTNLGLTWQVLDSADLARAARYSSPPFGFGNKIFVLQYMGIGGALVSSDNGTTWRNSMDGLPPTPPTSGYPISIGSVGSLLFLGIHGYGLYSSSDSGQFWHHVNGPDSIPYQIIGHGNYLFVSGESGTSRSSDGGNTWVTVLPCNRLFSLGDRLFAKRVDGLYRSSDKGNSWLQILDTGGAVDLSSFEDMAAYENNLFICTLGNLYFSSNLGDSWKPIGPPGPYTTSGAWDITIGDGNLFALIGSDVWRRSLSDFGISSVSQEAQLSVHTITAYPNPATNSTTIHFTAAAAGYASVTIVNALGVEVARVYSGELSAGEHSFSWLAGELPAGMYECLVRMNGEVSRAGIVLR